jgi:hypothetical protein
MLDVFELEVIAVRIPGLDTKIRKTNENPITNTLFFMVTIRYPNAL